VLHRRQLIERALESPAASVPSLAFFNAVHRLFDRLLVGGAQLVAGVLDQALAA